MTRLLLVPGRSNRKPHPEELGGRWFLAALTALFFLSGASALIYQVLWLRLLSLVFGVTVYAASTVLASFMSGLALGSFLAGRVADRLTNPLRFLGLVEALIGGSALLTPSLLQAMGGVYVWIHEQLPDSMAALTLARFVCSFAVILVPTVLMGATLPLVVKSSVFRMEGLGTRVAILYAANTAGGIAGAVTAGFYLIGGVGIGASHRLAATVNFSVAISLFVLSWCREVRDERAAQASVVDPAPRAGAFSPTPERTRRLVLVVFALSGFAALALEVIWFRVLLVFFTVSSYAFTTMLATVLGGIAAGSALVTFEMRKERDWVRALATLQLGTALAAVGSLTLLTVVFRAGWPASGMIPASVLAIFPATALMGASFPVGMRLWAAAAAESRGRLARRIGLLNALNLGGAILGSVASGFFLLSRLGSTAGLRAAAAIYLLCAFLLLSQHPSRRAAVRRAVLGAAAFLLASLTLPDPFNAVLARRYPGQRLLWREEGIQTTVTVQESAQGVRVLNLDGLHQANDSKDMVKLHRRLGHLPMALHPAPRKVLVLGLGGGATAGAVSQHAEAELELVELSPSVIRAAAWFKHINYDLFGRPGLRLRVDDGRNYLLLSRSQYDVITADLVQPFHAGAGSLYSLEYFQLIRSRLRPDGLMLQWIGRSPSTQYKLILRTFLTAFPETTLWDGGSMLVGVKGRLGLDRSRFERKLGNARTRAALEAVGLDSYQALRALFAAGPEELRRWAGDGPRLSDDRPLLEYYRSLPRNDPHVDLSGLRGDVNRFLPP